MILSTPGQAAKQLSKYTGLEDQELILNEIKSKISSIKSEAKHIIKDNIETEKKINELKKVPHFILKIKAIKQKEKEIEELNKKILQLENIIVSLKEVEKYKIDIKKINSYIQNLIEIKNNEEEIKTINKSIYLLTNLLEKIKNTKKYNIKNIDYHLLAVNSIKMYTDNFNTLLKSISTLEEFIAKGKFLLEQKEFNKSEAELAQNNLDMAWNILKVCPLCKQPLKGKHSC